MVLTANSVVHSFMVYYTFYCLFSIRDFYYPSTGRKINYLISLITTLQRYQQFKTCRENLLISLSTMVGQWRKQQPLKYLFYHFEDTSVLQKIKLGRKSASSQWLILYGKLWSYNLPIQGGSSFRRSGACVTGSFAMSMTNHQNQSHFHY